MQRTYALVPTQMFANEISLEDRLLHIREEEIDCLKKRLEVVRNEKSQLDYN